MVVATVAALPSGFWVDLPCPECGHRRILGYRMDNEHGGAMHTHYVCTFWGSGKPRACGWHGWVVPAWKSIEDDRSKERDG